MDTLPPSGLGVATSLLRWGAVTITYRSQGWKFEILLGTSLCNYTLTNTGWQWGFYDFVSNND